MLNGLALGIVYEATKGAIDRTSARMLADALKVVLPEAVSFSEQKESALPDGRAVDYHEGYASGGELVGYALSGKKQGYQSCLKVLVGVDRAGVIQGVKVLEQAETPGLGARLDEVLIHETLWGRIAAVVGKRRGAGEKPRPWFQEQYRGLTTDELVVLRPAQGGKGIHAMTGATITSRALTGAVRESVEGFMKARGGAQ
jgi:electron transport complex protein RnfG